MVIEMGCTLFVFFTKTDDLICSANNVIYIVVGDLNSRLERFEILTSDVPLSKPGQ